MLRVLVLLGVVLSLLFGFMSPANGNNSLVEGRIHWAGSPEGYARVVDRTGGTQPVREAVEIWNRSPDIKLAVAPDCNSGPCITIVRDDNMNPNHAGFARVYYTSNNRHINKVEIKLNGKMRLDPAAKLAVLCHEMGHGLGLGHRPDKTRTCMARVPERYPPDQHDFDELARNRVH